MDDDKYYETVAHELRENRINDALWTKAIAKSGGAEDKTKAVYIQLRVEQLFKEDQQQQAASLSSQVSESGWEEDEEAEAFQSDSIKRAAIMVGEFLLFIFGIWAVFNWLFPWIRSLKSQYFN